LTEHNLDSEASDYPQRCSKPLELIGTVFMKLAGWKVEGEIPRRNKVIIIAAPHTTNWDFVFLLGAAFHLGLSVKWLGKASLFAFPFGWIMRALGGISVDRSKANGMVEQVADTISTKAKISLVIPPSGTRNKTEYWKSGFYHIAKTAKVSIVCGYLDYEKKRAGLGPNFFVSESTSGDMDKIRAFYKNKAGKFPALTSRIRLKEEQ